MAGKHARQPKHAKPADRPPLVIRALLFIVVFVALGSALPVLLGLGLALGIMFGWLTRAITRT